MNGMPKYVVSRTLRDPTWNNSTVLSGDPVAEITALKDRVARDILRLGQLPARAPAGRQRPRRVGLPQHQTIRATIDWSHDLLREQERVVLRRLAVFAGGWTLEMAETVCSGAGIGPGDILDLLAQLVDKSMVLVDTSDAVARYRFLEPIRQYAMERLEASAEATNYSRRDWQHAQRQQGDSRERVTS
jgi:predicted ATPase